MDAITVSGLHKTFITTPKAAGLRGSLRALVRPERREITAVHNLSFRMSPGELLGFIGPNGAGKSTTIKILTGILHPTRGDVSVLGFTPWRERRALAYRLGSVFGQRPQLWYHLPALDTLLLFGKIYELDPAVVRQRIHLLAEAFEITDLLNTPVRKLSLGQRMRCEVAASLIHQPQLLLLDEPSIGLDVVAKQRLREVIRRMNTTEQVGVLLTSHDAGDIEALCQRVIVVNHGQIVFDDSVAALKRRYLTSKLVEVRYTEALPVNISIPGAELLAAEPYSLKLRFDTRQTAADALLAHLAALGSLADITITDPALEDVIAAMYAADAPPASPRSPTAVEKGAEG